MSGEERAPLLANPRSSVLHPSAPPFDRDGSPPPDYYQATGHIICVVCGYNIDTTEIRNAYEVTCRKCHEETPIGNPPRGKRYSRCTFCNKLLKYPKTAAGVSCSRCKKVVDVSMPSVGAVVQSSSSNRSAVPSRSREAMYRFVCGHCNVESILDTAPGHHFQCRHCGRRSNANTSNKRAVACMVLGTLMVLLVLFLMFSTAVLRHNYAYWVIYLILLIIATFLHGCGLWLLCIKKSVVQVVPPQSNI